MKLQQLINQLSNYSPSEAKAIVLLLLEDVFHISRVDACLGALDRMDSADVQRLDEMMLRLQNGEPVQYVIGNAWFMDRQFHVEPGVLIPRPETEELVEWVRSDFEHHTQEKLNVLDVGCGSGCISVSIALEISHAEVTAWDLSATALKVTTLNAERHNANVTALKQDALNAPSNDVGMWDVIVSNPPYICNCEAAEMESHVLDHEPHEALFVPDADPLLFYRAIAGYAHHALKRGGALYFEINRAYGNETCAMLQQLGFASVELRKDQYGNARMIKACLF